MTRIIHADLADKIGRFLVRCALAKKDGQNINLADEVSFTELHSTLYEKIVAGNSGESSPDLYSDLSMYLHVIACLVDREGITVSDVATASIDPVNIGKDDIFDPVPLAQYLKSNIFIQEP